MNKTNKLINTSKLTNVSLDELDNKGDKDMKEEPNTSSNAVLNEFNHERSYELPRNWMKINLNSEFSLYYDWKNNLYSFTPVFDQISFLDLVVSQYLFEILTFCIVLKNWFLS